MNAFSKLAVSALAGAALLALPVGPIGATAAQAQDFPAKPIEVIVPFKPGGRTDVVARLIGEKIQEMGYLPQPMAVVNADGGAGANAVNRMPVSYTYLTLPTKRIV